MRYIQADIVENVNKDGEEVNSTKYVLKDTCRIPT